VRVSERKENGNGSSVRRWKGGNRKDEQLLYSSIKRGKKNVSDGDEREKADYIYEEKKKEVDKQGDV